MLDALPRHVGDVQQAIDATQVDERTVVGEVLDRALHDRAFLQVVHQRAALGGEFLLHDRAARHDHVVALLVELDDLELERLAFEVAGVAHGAHIHQRTGQERAHVFQLDREATLDAAGDDAGDDFGIVEGLLEARPGAGTLGLFARQAGFAVAVFDGIEGDFDIIASGDFDFAAFVAELVDGDDGFGLQAHVHDDHVVANADDPAGEDHARANTLIRQALFEHFAERFGHVSTRCVRRRLTEALTRLPKKRRHRISCDRRPISIIAWAKARARRASAMTRSTTASMERPVLSTRTASAAGFRGATARVESRLSRSAISSERAARLAPEPLSFNCL